MKSKEEQAPPDKKQDWFITDWQHIRRDSANTKAIKKKSAKMLINF